MPNLPDVPGKDLLAGMTKRTWVVVTAVATGAVTVGGVVAKRVLRHGGDGDTPAASADPIAETPTAPPGSEEKPVPQPKPAKPKGAKPKPAKPKAKAAPKPKAEPKAKAKAEPKPKPEPKPRADKPKPAKPKAAPKPKSEPKAAGGKDPHHALNNPVVDDPDPTEFPDPYDKREDPLDPVDPDGAPFGDEPHPATGAESTSEPPLSQDPEVPEGGKPPRRENLDE